MTEHPGPGSFWSSGWWVNEVGLNGQRAESKERKQDMSNWSTYTKEAETATGGEKPIVDDDVYEARVVDVADWWEELNAYKKKDTDPDIRTRSFATFELLEGDASGTTLRYYFDIPVGYIKDGVLDGRAKLYKLMDALGYDMAGRYKVAPLEWIDRRCRVVVENDKDAEPGTKWPSVVKLMTLRQKAAAGRSGGLRSRMGEE